MTTKNSCNDAFRKLIKFRLKSKNYNMSIENLLISCNEEEEEANEKKKV